MPISLLNGLSAMGSSIADYAGTAGLEQQKAALANQSAVLADQLATTRETTLQGQQQQFLAGQQTSSQTFQAGQNTQEQAAAASRQQAQLAVTQAEGAATRAAEKARQDALLAQPPEIIRTLRALGALPPAGATPTDGSAAPAPADSGSAAPSTDTTDIPFDTGQASATPPASAGTSTPTPSTGGTASPGGAAPNLAQNLINKTLGLPMAGSPEATRMAIASDVNNDPAFKYKTPGQKAAEVETRVAVATGKMTDPAARTAVAQGIASYQLSPLEGRALALPGGDETMKEVLALNPGYQASKFPEINKAMTAFATGPQGNAVRFNNVGVQHLDVLDQAATALGNGNVQALNSLKNTFQQQFGSPEPTTFDGLKQIVGTEIEKAIAGGIGASADRDRIMAALSRANSPAQLQAITDGFRSLMVGQLAGLKQQYEEATGFKGGPFAFENKLAPETVAKLSGNAKAPSATTTGGSAASTDDQSLSIDANGVPSFAPPASKIPPPAATNPALMRLWGQ